MTIFRIMGVALLLLLSELLAAEMESVDSPSVRFINQQISDPALRFSDHSIDVDGQRLHYVSAGSGKLILFYHGFPSYWYMWKNQLLDLAADYRVVAVDGLGANLSAKPNELAPYHVSALTRFGAVPGWGVDDDVLHRTALPQRRRHQGHGRQGPQGR
jgi:hypothetical protein